MPIKQLNIDQYNIQRVQKSEISEFKALTELHFVLNYLLLDSFFCFFVLKQPALLEEEVC